MNHNELVGWIAVIIAALATIGGVVAHDWEPRQ